MVDRARVGGAELTLKDLKGVLDTHQLQEGAMSLRDWRLLLALQFGDVALKAREAFALLDQDGDGLVELNALKRLIQLFEVSTQTSDAIAIEIHEERERVFAVDKPIAVIIGVTRISNTVSVIICLFCIGDSRAVVLKIFEPVSYTHLTLPTSG